MPDELNPDPARKIGQSLASVYNLTRVVVGRDIRLSSENLAKALVDGLRDMGCEVLYLGLTDTKEIDHVTYVSV